MSSSSTPTASPSGSESALTSGVSGLSGDDGLATGAEPGGQLDGGQLATEQIDRLAADAVDLARAAAEDVAEPGTVGEHLGVRAEGPGLVLHTFACTSRGYRGWQWAVSLARVPDSDIVTVCDSVLLPGDESVLAPQWLPWSDRLAPGDLGAGDELPYRDDDPLLVPGYMATDTDDADQVEFWELGLGRVRVLGREGREEAATRWYRGSPGPTSEIALQAPAQCSTCGYFVALSGGLRLAFGVCANEWSPSDASVVSVDHGCGAHSETDVAPPEPEPIPDMIVDDSVLDVIALEPDPEPAVVPEPETDADLLSEPDAEAVDTQVDPEPGVDLSDSIAEAEQAAGLDQATGPDQASAGSAGMAGSGELTDAADVTYPAEPAHTFESAEPVDTAGTVDAAEPSALASPPMGQTPVTAERAAEAEALDTAAPSTGSEPVAGAEPAANAELGAPARSAELARPEQGTEAEPVTESEPFAQIDAVDPVSDAPAPPDEGAVPVEDLEPLTDVNDAAGLSAGSVEVAPGDGSPDESPLLDDPRPEVHSTTRDDAQDALQAQVQAGARSSDTEDGEQPAGAEPPAS